MLQDLLRGDKMKIESAQNKKHLSKQEILKEFDCKKNKTIIFIIGLPGSGKTTISSMLSKKYSISALSTESVRALFLGVDSVTEDCDFTKEELEIVYDAIIKNTKTILESRDAIIIDGVYREKKQRESIYKLVENDSSYMIFKFFIKAEEKVILERLKKRKANGSVAPAGIKTFLKIKKEYQYPVESEGFISIDNTFNVCSAFDEICKIIEGNCLI